MLTCMFLKWFSVAAYYCISPPLLSTLLKVPCPQEMFLLSFFIAIACVAAASIEILKKKSYRLRVFFTRLYIMENFYVAVYGTVFCTLPFVCLLLLTHWIGATVFGLFTALGAYMTVYNYKQCKTELDIFDFMVRI